MFGLLFGRPKPRRLVVEARARVGRPTRSEAAEKRRQRVADERAEMDLQLAKAKAARELRRLQDDEQSEIGISDLPRLSRQLEAIGLQIAPKGSGTPIGQKEGLRGFLEGFLTSEGGAMVGNVLASKVGTGGAAQASRAPPPPIAIAPRPPTPASEEHRLRRPADDSTWSMDARELAAGLAGKTPTEGAGWLVAAARAEPGYVTLVSALANTPDEGLAELLDRIALVKHSVHPATVWLKAEMSWLVAATGELRRMVSAAATAEAAEATSAEADPSPIGW